ncbi:MAG: glycoside hydrolase family 3 N-terminal domain-containing protein [Elusimicrobiales bacterium]|jgi:beta-glucosidase-like glycosyl hydrolase
MELRKLARLIHPEFRFGSTTLEQALGLVELGVGGFCLYGGSVNEVFETVRTLRAASKTPLLFSADYENGAGQVLADATELPSNMAVGASGSAAIARRKGEITAAEAKALGVDWIFAPVADLAVNPSNPIVNLRSYGAAPALVSELAGAYISGLHAYGAVSTLKHFPGHGETSVDSHLVLPVLDRSLEDLEGAELKPYRSLLARADSVMAGHLQLPALDPDFPASLSRNIITGLLRGSMGYDGCVITDALNMKAVAEGGAAGLTALLAGADILLSPDDARRLYGVLCRAADDGVIAEPMVDRALARQDALVKKCSAVPAEPGGLSLVGCAEHRAFARGISVNCLAWAFQRKSFILRPGEIVFYMEPLTPRAEWQGKVFVEELVRLGVRVEPFRSGAAGKVVIGSFSRPRAFSGAINLSAAAAAEIEGVVSGGGEILMSAFGSPFVFDGFHRRLAAGLCAFGGLADLQRGAAAVLTGAAAPGGKMPVDLKLYE